MVVRKCYLQFVYNDLLYLKKKHFTFCLSKSIKIKDSLMAFYQKLSLGREVQKLVLKQFYTQLDLY